MTIDTRRGFRCQAADGTTAAVAPQPPGQLNKANIPAVPKNAGVAME